MSEASSLGEHGMSRRGFAAGTAGLAAAMLAGSAMGQSVPPVPTTLPTQPAAAPQKKVKIGLIGCGGRGVWLAKLAQQHGGYEVHAVADYFAPAAEAGGNALNVDKARRFTGLGGYRKLIDSGVEAVLVLDVPYFYPEQAKAAVDAGCHVYMAKPIAVDVPGCLTVLEASRQAAAKKKVFLVDYQLPLEPANMEVCRRVRDNALEGLAHAISYGFCGAWSDPAIPGGKLAGKTVESRLRGGVWLSDTVLSGDSIVSYDIHIIDGVMWMMGKRPLCAAGRSRTCRPQPHGDRVDCGAVVYTFDDGTVWTHVVQALNNNSQQGSLCATFFGVKATAHIHYGGKVFVSGGSKHWVGKCGSIYDDGAKRNLVWFHDCITQGVYDNPTPQRAVDGTLTAILGREAAARGTVLTMEQLLKENRKLELDLTGMDA